MPWTDRWTVGGCVGGCCCSFGALACGRLTGADYIFLIKLSQNVFHGLDYNYQVRFCLLCSVQRCRSTSAGGGKRRKRESIMFIAEYVIIKFWRISWAKNKIFNDKGIVLHHGLLLCMTGSSIYIPFKVLMSVGGRSELNSLSFIST